MMLMYTWLDSVWLSDPDLLKKKALRRKLLVDLDRMIMRKTPTRTEACIVSLEESFFMLLSLV